MTSRIVTGSHPVIGWPISSLRPEPVGGGGHSQPNFSRAGPWRGRLAGCLAGLTLFAIARAAEPMPASLYSPARDTLVYVGTYTRSTSKGIYVFRLQTQNDEVSQNILLVPLGLAVEASNPSFLELDPKRRLVFLPLENSRSSISVRREARGRVISCWIVREKTSSWPITPAAAWRCCGWKPTDGWAK